MGSGERESRIPGRKRFVKCGENVAEIGVVWYNIKA